MTRRKQKQPTRGKPKGVSIYHLLKGTWSGEWASRLQSNNYFVIYILDSFFSLDVNGMMPNLKPPKEEVCREILHKVERDLTLGKISTTDPVDTRMSYFLDNFYYECPAICSWFVRLLPIFQQNPMKYEPFKREL